MKSLVMRIHPHPFIVAPREKHGRRRWHEIDCRLLLDVAERDGWKCAKLEQLVEEQDARARGTYVASPSADELTAQFNQEPRYGV